MATNMTIVLDVSVTAAAVNPDGTWDLTPSYAVNQMIPLVAGVFSADGGIDLATMWNGANQKDYKPNTDISWNLVTTSIAVGDQTMTLAFPSPSTDAIILQPDSNDISKKRTNSATQVAITDNGRKNAVYTYALVLACALGGETKLVTLDPPIVNRKG